jgi:hypothetical protein
VRDWDIPALPDELETPWATVLLRLKDGNYAELESGRTASASAWRDRFARHHERGRPTWRRSSAGVAYVPDGDRFAFLWCDPAAPVCGWSAGTGSATGELDGEWLLRDVRFELARRAAEEWYVARRAVQVVDVDARLSLPAATVP